MSKTSLIHCEFFNSDCSSASHFDPRLICLLKGTVRVQIMEQEFSLNNTNAAFFPLRRALSRPLIRKPNKA